VKVRSLTSVLLLVAIPTGVLAQRRLMVVGGGGRPWEEVAQLSVALDYRAVPGAVQPRELKPWENILTPPPGGRELTNIFGFEWYRRGKRGMEAEMKTLGLHPRIWQAENGWVPAELIDGDTLNCETLKTLVPRDEYYRLGTVTGGAWEFGYAILDQEVYTIDLGIPVPVNRIRFFPPQKGVDRRGGLYRNDFPRAYEVSVALKPKGYLLTEIEDVPNYAYHSLEDVVARTTANSKSIVDVTFPTQFVRFIRLKFNLMPQTYTLAEIQVFGEGFPPKAWYVSKAISFGEPVNFGRIFYKFRKFRRTAVGEYVEDESAPVKLTLETKTGSDDTPTAYHIVGELGDEVEVSKEEYRRAPAPRVGQTPLPGMRGSVTEDDENWDPWSSPYESSGEEVRSSDGRQYLQFRFRLESGDPFAFGRLDSLAFEYSPLLAAKILGEVSLADEPSPPRGVVEVPAGVDTLFVYDIRAEFTSPEQEGFDGVSLEVPPGTRFVGLEMGEPLREVAPRDVTEGDGELTVVLPSRITMGNNLPVRLKFRTALLSSGVYFAGRAFSTEGENLPQSVDPGDANPDVSTDGLQVFTSEQSLGPLSSFGVHPKVATPNGDLRDEEVVVSFHIFQVKRASAEVEVRDLSGRRVRKVFSGKLPKGRYYFRWDCRDEGGKLVPPGVYLCRVVVSTGSGRSEGTKLVCVAY